VFENKYCTIHFLKVERQWIKIRKKNEGRKVGKEQCATEKINVRRSLKEHFF